jgi:hypothetical protein
MLTLGVVMTEGAEASVDRGSPVEDAFVAKLSHARAMRDGAGREVVLAGRRMRADTAQTEA